MRGGRVFYSLVWAVGVLVPALAVANPVVQTTLPAIQLSPRFAPRIFAARSYVPSLAHSGVSQAVNGAHQIFLGDAAGDPGTLTDPLASRSSPFFGSRRSYGPLVWHNFGGPAFAWASPTREMCARTNACLSNAPTLEVTTPTFGGLIWAAGGGPVVRLGRGRMELGSLGRAELSFEGSFHGMVAGYQERAGIRDQRAIVGTNAAGGIALALRNVAIHMQVQTVLFLVERQASQPVGGQVFATMAIDWR